MPKIKLLFIEEEYREDEGLLRSLRDTSDWLEVSYEDLAKIHNHKFAIARKFRKEVKNTHASLEIIIVLEPSDPTILLKDILDFTLMEEEKKKKQEEAYKIKREKAEKAKLKKQQEKKAKINKLSEDQEKELFETLKKKYS